MTVLALYRASFPAKASHLLQFGEQVWQAHFQENLTINQAETHVKTTHFRLRRDVENMGKY